MPLIDIFHSALILGVFGYAVLRILRRPRDYFRLAPWARWAMAPAWAILILACAASPWLFRWEENGLAAYFQLLGEHAIPLVVQLLIAQACLVAGSVWVWESGLRGQGFGWLGAERRPWRRIAFWPFVLATLFANAITLVVFGLSGPIEINPEFQAELEIAESIGGWAFGIFLWTQTLLAPFFEEAFYRHFLQTRLARWFEKRGWSWLWACAAVSALWAYGHAGMLAQDWLKFAQIFPIGILFGILQRRWGWATATAAHLGLNVGVLFYGGLLG